METMNVAEGICGTRPPEVAIQSASRASMELTAARVVWPVGTGRDVNPCARSVLTGRAMCPTAVLTQPLQPRS